MSFKRFQNISYQYDNVGIYNRSLKWANMYHLKMVSGDGASINYVLGFLTLLLVEKLTHKFTI